MFSKYYQSELAYLRELGREFALANPTVAPLLAERSSDPDVERLLEGVAFLTARIRERVGDDAPEIVHALADVIFPHYVRVLPSCSILEFAPISGTIRGRHRVPRGTEIASVPVEGTSCRFQTTFDVDLLPLSILEAAIDASSANSPILRMQFQTTEQGRSAVFQPDGLRLFVHADFGLASMLMLWLLRYCRGVSVKGSSGKGRPIKLRNTVIRPVGFEPNQALFPWPQFGTEGYRQIQEYFSLPAKFLFFDVTGLDAASSITEDRFEIAFHFDRPPQLPARISRETFRLFCAPIINLFKNDADPIRRGLAFQEHILRPSELDPKAAEVYAVETVTGLVTGRTDRKAYQPFFSFSHAGEATDDFGYYRIRHKPSLMDDGLDAYLSIATPRDIPPTSAEETLSIELVCTNRSLAGQLRVGDISVPTAGSPTVARFKNLIPATQAVRPPMGASLHWRLVSHLAVNQRSFGYPEVLRTALNLYNFQDTADRQAGRANRLRVDAIRGVSLRAVERHLSGVPVRGIGSTIEVEEANFASEGDAFLFGSILDELFAAHVSINSFSELTIRLQPSKAEYAWPAKNGHQPIL